MSLNNDKTLLIYGFSIEEQQMLDDIVEKLELHPYRLINPYMADMKIKYIVKGLKIETYTGKLPEERVVLYNNFSDAELDKTIKAIREKIKENIIMAAITPISSKWTFKYLLEHLIKEREWYRLHK
ncbi:MAG: DUF3783 domain-containing protein [Bacillota bacterium]|nr:DUF3783 domain-containing protein [Bacillota bacterium]